MKNNSWVLTTVVSVLTLCLVLISVDEKYLSDNLDIVLSLASGSISMVLMAVSCMLAIRLPAYEKIFGGLDRVYEQHKWLGIWALVILSYHLLVKAGIKGADSQAIFQMARPWPHLIQGAAAIGLTMIIVTSLNRSIRYSLWRWIHKLSGFVFLIAAAHWLTAKTIITLTSPAGLWMAVLCGLGAAAFLYRLVVYDWLHHGKAYEVTEIDKFPRGMTLTIKPKGKSIDYHPGSFVFLSFKQKGMSEPHPFSVASAPHEDGSLSFVIRSEGDWTRQLRKQLEIGTALQVIGPYGKFHRTDDGKSEVWVAGGVGIAPFMAWLESMSEPPTSPIHLYYSYREDDAIVDRERLQNLAEEKGVIFTALCSTKGETLQREHLDVITAAKDKIRAYYCGPEGLCKALRSIMRKTGIPASQLKTELFNFR